MGEHECERLTRLLNANGTKGSGPTAHTARQTCMTIGTLSKMGGEKMETELIACLDCGLEQRHFWCKTCMDKWILEQASA